MSLLPAPLEPVRPALLTRVAPVTRLTVGAVFLVAVVLTVDPLVAARLAALDVAALVLASGLPLGRVPARLSPLVLAAAGLALLTVLVHPSLHEPSVPAVAALGPLRLTAPALAAGLAMALRLAVIALTTLLVFSTSDPTSLADSLVQQWHAPPRFAYGTLAALRIAPLLAGDWVAIGAARRVRGVESRGVRERISNAAARLLVLLVTALRRAERMALAMDARGFDSGVPRSHYRAMRTGPLDVAFLVAGVALAIAAVAFR